jgi:DNA-binding SARP family transcriptional activator
MKKAPRQVPARKSARAKRGVPAAPSDRQSRHRSTPPRSSLAPAAHHQRKLEEAGTRREEVKFKVLGPPELTVGGTQSIRLSPRLWTVLASLLLSDGKTVPVDSLVDHLWGWNPPPMATASVRTYVSRINALLAREGLRIGRQAHGYQLPVDPHAVDLHRFRSLRRQAESVAESGDLGHAVALLTQADGLWRGSALMGLSGEWAAVRRHALDEEHREAVKRRIGIELDRGRQESILGELRELSERHPLDAEIAQALTIALYKLGRQKDAIEVGRNVSERFAEAGMELGPQLRDVHTRILRGDAALRVTPASPSLGQGSQPDTLPLEATNLVGRAKEARLLAAGYRVADVLPAADRRADWSLVRALFHQLALLAESGDTPNPDGLTGAFADELAVISASYAGREAELSEHALAVLADVDSGEILDLDLFRKYYQDERFSPPRAAAAHRRGPSPFEAIVETCRRLRDARSLQEASWGTGTSGLLIDSMSYGRFCDIRGNLHGSTASDLDFIVVSDQASIPGEIATAVASLPGVAVSDLEHFRRRAREFSDGLDDGGTVFSHKFRLWTGSTPDPLLPPAVAPGDYLLSLHIITPPVLDYLLVASATRLLKEAAGSRRTLRDYRQAPTSGQADLHDFAGRRHHADLGTEPAAHDYLTSSYVYYIDDLDCYFPGFYQTMLFPQADVLWDDLDIRPAIDEFRQKLRERIRYEAAQRRHAMLRPSFAHIRRSAFAPGIIRLLDAGY